MGNESTSKTMERVITSLDDKIDYYLHKMSVASNLTLHPRDLYEVPVLDAETYLLDQVMLEKGLLRINKEMRVLSTKGLEISNFGGWVAYKKQLTKERFLKEPKSESEKKLTLEIHQLKKETQDLRLELKRRNEKDVATTMIIKNLVRQRRANTILLLLAGMSIGFIIANLKALLLIF
jgi:hypothetical protein